jgi:hypothetical protein
VAGDPPALTIVDNHAGRLDWNDDDTWQEGKALTTPSLATCSYFEYKPEMGQAVRISLGLPRFWKTIPRLTELNPPKKYFDAKPWVFAPKYIEYLETITAYRIQEKIEGLQREFEGTLVLLCFEKNVRGPIDCHRRRFAEWWYLKTGEWVPELGGRYASLQAQPPAEIDPARSEQPPPDETVTVSLGPDTPDTIIVRQDLLFPG